jgi:glutathionyl-hydroquinone reductase
MHLQGKQRITFFSTLYRFKKIYSFHKKCKTPEIQCAVDLRKYTHILSTRWGNKQLKKLEDKRYFRSLTTIHEHTILTNNK